MKAYQLYLLREGAWVEEEVLEGKSRKAVAKMVRDKLFTLTWKLRT